MCVCVFAAGMPRRAGDCWGGDGNGYGVCARTCRHAVLEETVLEEAVISSLVLRSLLLRSLQERFLRVSAEQWLAEQSLRTRL